MEVVVDHRAGWRVYYFLGIFYRDISFDKIRPNYNGGCLCVEQRPDRSRTNGFRSVAFENYSSLTHYRGFLPLETVFIPYLSSQARVKLQ